MINCQLSIATFSSSFQSFDEFSATRWSQAENQAKIVERRTCLFNQASSCMSACRCVLTIRKANKNVVKYLYSIFLGYHHDVKRAKEMFPVVFEKRILKYKSIARLLSKWLSFFFHFFRVNRGKYVYIIRLVKHFQRQKLKKRLLFYKAAFCLFLLLLTQQLSYSLIDKG